MMKSKIVMFGIDIPIGVDKKKRRKRGAKAPLKPKRDKMMQSPHDGGTTAVKTR